MKSKLLVVSASECECECECGCECECERACNVTEAEPWKHHDQSEITIKEQQQLRSISWAFDCERNV